MLGNLRDVQQSIRAGEELNKRAELSQTNHLTQISLANLRHSSQIADDRQRLVESIGIARRHIDPARIVDVDLHTSLLDDAANRLPARSDQIANLVRRNVHGANLRRVLRALNTRPI